MSITNKVALVTGASSGIGEETAKGLLANGYTVYAGARRVERMQQLTALGARVLTLDVTDDASMSTAVGVILQEMGHIDLLVNNAGYGSYGSLEDVPLQEGRRQFEVNVFGLARLTQLVLPTMRALRAGRIINIASIAGKVGEPFGTWYHATKFAVEGLSDSLRMELRPFGIDVVIIEPGAILTEWNGIAREGLIKYSGSTAYSDSARAHVNMMASADRGSLPSPPSVVARTILKAALAKKPKTRYATGGGAKMVLSLHHMLSDRAFDGLLRLISSQAQKKEVILDEPLKSDA
ncbi:MAG: oxidoreductase [Pseudomonas sp.]|uniref:oxidoreductase n=1 Tax=Pseudomonas sp. TaxID=306 RepID=UPI003C72B5F4